MDLNCSFIPKKMACRIKDILVTSAELLYNVYVFKHQLYTINRHNFYFLIKD